VNKYFFVKRANNGSDNKTVQIKLPRADFVGILYADEFETDDLVVSGIALSVTLLKLSDMLPG
jgi:hypothetical protein